MPQLSKTLENLFSFLWLTRKVFGLVWQAHPVYTALVLVTNLILGVMPAVHIWIGKLVVDAVVLGIGGDVSAGIVRVAGLLLLGLIVSLFGDGMESLSLYCWENLEGQVDRFFHLEVLEKSLSLDLAYWEDDKFYNLLDKVERHATRRPARMITALLSLIQGAAGSISVLSLLVHLSGWVVAILVLANIPRIIFGFRFAGQRYSITDWRSPQSRRLNYLSDLAVFHAASEVRLYGLAGYFIKQIKKLYENFLQENSIFNRRKYAAGFGLVDLFSDVSYYGLYLWVIVQALLQKFTLGDVTLYSGAFNRLQRELSRIFDRTSELYEHSLFIRDYFDFLKLGPRIISPPDGIKFIRVAESGIEFRNVTFRYKEEGPDVLKDVSFKISPNENIALVGENGAGKTTLIKLLARIYDPQQGQILINGKDLREYDLVSLYEKIGILLQNFVRYELTVAENIGFGKISELENLDKIKSVAQKAEAAGFIEKLPQGYQTVLGRRFEGGIDLSLGQWQRLALARAFMREAEILILDEPTASLDAKAEYEIFQKFIELTAGKIAILISHRFSTVRMAQKIYVVDQGEIIEEGSHEELMSKNGHYAKLFSLQAQGYK